MLVSGLGEEALLERMRDLFAVPADRVAVGIGDDAAVTGPPAEGEQEVWTADVLLEGIHFRHEWQSAADLGRKCLAVNLSDIASMGAAPRFALLSLACGAGTEVEYIMEFCRGVKDLSDEFGVTVIGGDTSASAGGLVVGITASGTVPEGMAVLRSGARPGDRLCVTGYLGCASAGIRILQDVRSGGDAGRESPSGMDVLLRSFIAPEARIRAGIAAREAGATAMTDVSDGLASDLRHICAASSVGAVIERDSILIHPELEAAASREGWEIDRLVLVGGEDYELLFTVPAESFETARDRVEAAGGAPVTAIGEIVSESEGIRIMNADGTVEDLPRHGFDHFLSDG